MSNKKNICDLFINVLEQLKMEQIIPQLSTLFSFVGNLCYSKEGDKFRAFLQPHYDFILKKISHIFMSIQFEADFMRLWLALINFLVNLSTHSQFRGKLASNCEGILKFLIETCITCIKKKHTGWDMQLEYCLGILINISLDISSHELLCDFNLPRQFNSLMSSEYNRNSEVYIRLLNLCGKMTKCAQFMQQIFNSLFLINHIITDFESFMNKSLDNSIRYKVGLFNSF